MKTSDPLVPMGGNGRRHRLPAARLRVLPTGDYARTAAARPDELESGGKSAKITPQL